MVGSQVQSSADLLAASCQSHVLDLTPVITSDCKARSEVEIPSQCESCPLPSRCWSPYIRSYTGVFDACYLNKTAGGHCETASLEIELSRLAFEGHAISCMGSISGVVEDGLVLQTHSLAQPYAPRRTRLNFPVLVEHRNKAYIDRGRKRSL